MAEAQLPEDGGNAASADEDAAFRALVSEHHALDEQLRRLSAQHYLSADQQRTATSLKKHKLALKDRIARLEREQARGARSA